MHLRADEHLLEMGIKLNDEGAAVRGEVPRTVGSSWDIISQMTVFFIKINHVLLLRNISHKGFIK